MNMQNMRLGLFKTLLGAALASSLGTVVSAQALPTETDDDTIVLSPFTVTSSEGDQLYSPEQTTTGTIIAKNRDKVPFDTLAVTDTMLDDMLLDNPTDYASMIAGVSQGDGDQIARDGGAGGNALSYRSRGFGITPLYNGFQTGGSNHSPDSIGRVDVMKTPNSILYGQSSAGGTINFVPKAPQYSPHGSVGAGIWSNSGGRFFFDVGGPLGDGKKTAVRIGGGTQNFEREQEFFESAQSSVYGALNHKISDKISLEATAEYIDLKYTPSRTAAFPSVGSGVNRVSDPYNRLRNDRNFSYHGPHQYTARDTVLSSTYLTAEMAENLTLRVGGFYGYQEYEHQLLTGTYGLGTNETANGNYGNGDGNQETTGFKVDLLHSGRFMGMEIETLLGFESHDENSYTREVRTDPSVTPIIVSIPFSRRLLGSDFPAAPPDNFFTVLNSDSRNTLDWTNIRLTQFITANEGSTTAMWGLARGEGNTATFDNRRGNSSNGGGEDSTYTLGGTHTLFDRDDLSMTVYANYSTSFVMQSGNQQNPADFVGFATLAELEAFIGTVQPNAIEPQTGSGFEVGARFNFPEKNLRLSVGYFDQSRENIARGFFVRKSNAGDSNDEQVIESYSLASGEERSKGIDISLDWNPSDALSFTASAALMDGEVVANEEVPAEVGFSLIRHPETQLAFWGLYSFGDDRNRGFSVGLGASYNTATRVFPAFHDRFRLSDDYTMARALIRYKYKVGEYDHALSVNIDNLLDQEFTYEAAQLSEPILYKLTYTVGW